MSFIIWDVSPEIFSFLPVRWYGLLFAVAFLLSAQAMIKIFKIEGREEKNDDMILIYMIAGTVLGARLGHCIFYDWDYYSQHLLEILQIWKGGLASHGAGIGLLLASYFCYKKFNFPSFLYFIDRLAIAVAIAGCLVRLGNLMNSEIVGKPTNDAWGFVFSENVERGLEGRQNINEVSFERKDGTFEAFGQEFQPMTMSVTFEGLTPQIAKQTVASFLPRVRPMNELQDPEAEPVYVVYPETITPEVSRNGREITVTVETLGVPRHPAQLYESLGMLLILGILVFVYSRYKATTPEGLLIGIFFVLTFGARFGYEFLKENQVAKEADMTLNMGQQLSIPAVLAGLALIVFALVKGPRKVKGDI